MEIEHGPFQRRIQFVEQVDPANARAEYQRGLLTVTMPIAEREPEPAQEKVSIKIGRGT
jgi:HSP20 family molecular chaperone IbpA